MMIKQEAGQPSFGRKAHEKSSSHLQVGIQDIQIQFRNDAPC